MTDVVLRVPRQRPAPRDVLTSQTRAWQTLKAEYPENYRHELAHAEEGPRAGADGWVHARR